MSLRTRKTVFQLTPLLDLLLIVIFAQYMDVREAGARQEERIEAAVRERVEADAPALDTERLRVAELESEVERLQRIREEAEAQSRQLAAQRESLGEALAELFQVPDEVVEEILKEEPFRDNPAVRETFDRLKQGRTREAIKHVLSYAEILKRCDLWEVYLDYLPTEKVPQVRLTAGGQRVLLDAETAAAFQRELFEQYKQMPQPKSLVIVLFGYESGELPFGVRFDFSQALRDAVQRMNEDSLGRTRFYYSDLGDLLTAGEEPAVSDN